MKKKLALLLPLLIVPMFTSCGNTEPGIVQLTFGDLINESTIQLSTSDFQTMMGNKENFLMAIYPEGSTCRCWSSFEQILDVAVKYDHLSIYKYYAHDVPYNTVMKKLGGFYSYNDRPTFYILGEGKLIKAFDYNSENPFFKNSEGFMAQINKYCYLPKLMKIDEDKLKEVRSSDGVIYFARGTCSDCNYATPNAVTPYFYNHQNAKSIYYFDMDIYFDNWDNYLQKCKDYLLAEATNPTLGFGRGFVPTFQIYESGVLKDMCVYFNDQDLTYSVSDDLYYATKTYYTEERSKILHYLDNVEVKDLSKVPFAPSDTVKYGDNYYLKEDVAAKYHNVFLNAFLDAYTK